MKTFRLITFLLIIQATRLFGQGINFESGSSWAQIKDKAKAEHKYIFIDCYATWCGPCKQMDLEVYTDTAVGQFANEKFISVKVQMDSTKNDNEQVKAWYADAKTLKTQYKVGAFPTFLFFDENGKIVHQNFGFREAPEFRRMMANATNPDKQYFTLLENYKSGTIKTKNLRYLALLAMQFNEKELANETAKAYIKGELDNLTPENFSNKPNMEFTGYFVGLLNSKDHYFELLKTYPRIADTASHSGFARQVIDNVVVREEFINKLWADTKTLKPYKAEPDWNAIKATIKEKYGTAYADSIMLPNQLSFYALTKSWKPYTALIQSALKTHPPTTNGKGFGAATGTLAMGMLREDPYSLNQIAWDNYFTQCNNPAGLEEGLELSILSIRLLPVTSADLHQFYDTKANLLYKLKRTKEAIATEQQAIATLKKNNDDAAVKFWSKGYQETIAKMKKGQPTWPTK